jgi:asparagine synthase (glutamine-hydrolysing)
MCGIAGFVDFSGNSSLSDLVRMKESLAHRGPDASGTYFDERGGVSIGLSHCRLSIIDLSDNAAQPMSFQHLTMVYNGEVYNFQEIKKELVKKGYEFFSHSDSEVVLKAFHHYGVDCVKKFIGMFAVVIYDRASERLYFIKDRAGVKPLNIYRTKDLILFGSDSRVFQHHPGFEKKISNTSLLQYLHFGYVPSPYSIFENVKKIEPGSVYSLDIVARRERKTVYWDVYDIYEKPELKISEDDAIERMDQLINQSVKYRTIADVPIGVLLSGGFDSSLVTYYLQENAETPVKTFTVGFKETGYDESQHAKKIADYLGTDHHELMVGTDEFIETVPKLANILDEPLNDASVIPSHLISKFASAYVKVAVSADGGEETFAGYENYINKYDRNRVASAALRCMPNFIFGYFTRMNNRARVRLLHELASKELIYEQKDFEREIILLASSRFDNRLTPFQSFVNIHNDCYEQRLLARDYKTRLLNDFLVKIDRASMFNSLELREPFLDHHLLDFMAQLPIELKCYGNEPKGLMKRLAYSKIPEGLLNRPKMGFTIPLEKWFHGELKNFVTEVLSPENIKQNPYFDSGSIQSLLSSFFRSGHSPSNYKNYKLLSGVIIFQLWYNQNF